MKARSVAGPFSLGVGFCSGEDLPRPRIRKASHDEPTVRTDPRHNKDLKGVFPPIRDPTQFQSLLKTVVRG